MSWCIVSQSRNMNVSPSGVKEHQVVQGATYRYRVGTASRLLSLVGREVDTNSGIEDSAGATHGGLLGG